MRNADGVTARLKKPQIYLPILLVLLVSFVYFTVSVLIWGFEIDYFPSEDGLRILSKGLNALLSFIWIIIVLQLYGHIKIYTILLIGSCSIYFSFYRVLMDEFLNGPIWVSLIEGLGFPLGMIFLSTGLFMWIGSHLKLKNEIEKLRIVDELSGLKNSRQLFVQLQRDLPHAKRYNRDLSIMIIDLDEFKSFNNRYGHLEGDRVIRIFGETLRNSVRTTDSAFRYGGEAFAVILPEIRIDEALITAERIRLAFNNVEFSPGPESVYCTASIGVSTYREDDTGKEIVRRAEEAMFLAKSNGRNRVHTII